MRENENEIKSREDVVAGRNSVIELLKSGREIESIYIVNGESKGSISKIIAMAREKGIPVKNVNQVKLDNMTAFANHQGVAAVTSAYEYKSVDDILKIAEEKGEDPFIIICDELEDAHNLGAIIRTAEAAGAHGIIIPKRHGVGLTAIVAKISVGAAEYMPVARVSNLASTIDELKKKNIWVYGADMDGQDYCSTDFSGGVALVIGSEGFGISRLIREKCDVMVSLPMRGHINSLNASVAAGILMYEVTRQKMKLNSKNFK